MYTNPDFCFDAESGLALKGRTESPFAGITGFSVKLIRMFEFRHNGRTIGFSRLEKGDPPMGVAFGEFKPEPEYFTSSIQLERLDAQTRRLEGLQCFTPEGIELKCKPGIALLVYEFSGAETHYEVSCLGVYEPHYETLFPHHSKAYQDSFKP